MKNVNIFKLVSPLIFISFVGATQAAESFEQAIKNATTSGQFRLGYISVNPDVAASNTTTAAGFGGIIKFETEKWKRMQFAIASYFSEKLDTLSGDNTTNQLNSDFLDSSSKSYAYLGEAYVNYTFNNGSLRLGRQQLDNPFINTDDIRMHPNTFSAVWLNMNLSDQLTLDAGTVSQMAGFDSGGSPDKFKRISNEGVIALGLTYKMKAHHTFQGWYYDFDDKYSQYYFDASYENGNFVAGLQYSSYQEENASNIDGSVYGITANYTMGPVTLGVSINEGSNDTGKSADLGLGGGNYYASMEEMTIGGLTDASARVLSVEYAATEKFTASLAVGKFEDEAKSTDIDETDLVLAYSINDKLDAELVHTVVDNKADSTDAGTNFSRQVARLSYNF